MPSCITLATPGLVRWLFGLNITSIVRKDKANQWIIDSQSRMTCNVLTKLHGQAIQGGNLKILAVIMAYKNNLTVLCQHHYWWPPLTNQTLRTPKSQFTVGMAVPRWTHYRMSKNDSKHCSVEFRKLHLWVSHIPDSHELNVRQRPQRESTFCKWYHSTTCFWN